MSDKQFQKKIDALSKANERYKNLLSECEEEIIRRFGYSPSDVDCDDWIDLFYEGTGCMTVEELNQSMTEALKLKGCQDE